MILVINGSPRREGNLSRLLEKIALDTGLPYEMVHLAKLKINPCLGCVSCAPTNVCFQPDDMLPLYPKIVDADILLVGGVVYFGQMNALTHTFLERLYPLRHREPLTQGKLAAAVSVGGMEAEKGLGQMTAFLEKYFYYQVVGDLAWDSLTPPCYTCGFGVVCQYGAPAMMLGPEKLAEFKITPEMLRRFEDDPEVVDRAAQLSRDLSRAAILFK